MANVSGVGTVWNAPNYLGELYIIGAISTPFLNMIGGLQGDRVKMVKGIEFPVAQSWALNAASQPAITETVSMTAPTATTYVRELDINSIQIFQQTVTLSYLKDSVTGFVKADATTGLVDITQMNPVANELDFQISANLRQIALDVEYTFLNGAYQQATSATVAPKCRGIITAATTNTVAAGAATLDKALFNQLLRTMAANGSEFRNPVVFCNAFQKQKLSEIYGYAPTDRNVGGVNIKQVETDFAMLGMHPRVP